MALMDNTGNEGQQMKAPVDKVVAMRQQGMTNDQIIQALQKENYSSSLIFDALNQTELSSETKVAQENTYSPKEADEQLTSTSNEELIEAIIDEKWTELVKDINKIIDWKNRMEQKIAVIERQFDDLKTNFDKVHTAIMGKIGDYDKNILEVGADIKAMEQVFQKIIPTLTENVKELSKITNTAKKKGL